MSTLTDIISSAKSQIKSNTGSNSLSIKSQVANEIQNSKQAVASVIPNAVNGLTNKAASGVSNALNTGFDAVKSAATQAISGNFSGALDTLTSTPKDIAGVLASTFGLGSGSLLSNPGNGGVTPGNSLAGALARSDPQMSYNWWAQLPDIAPIGGGRPASLPWYYCEEATTPFRTITKRAVFRNGRNSHYPGMYDVDSLRLSLYNDVSGKVLAYLNAWQSAIIAPTTIKDNQSNGGMYGRPANHKPNITIFMLSPTKQLIASLTYIGCWPETIDAYALDSATSTRIVTHVTFSVDDVILTMSDASQTGVSGFLASAADSLINKGINSIISGLA